MLRPVFSWTAPDPALPTLVTIASTSDVPLLERSVASLLRCNRRRPAMRFFGDSGQAVQALRKAFGESVPGLGVENWDSLLPGLTPDEQQFIQTYAATSPWGGFAKKLAVLLAMSSPGPILFSDADVIWSGSVLDDFVALVADRTALYAGSDYQRAYDPALARALGESRLFDAVPINTGFLHVPRGVLRRHLSSETLFSATEFIQNPHVHVEQTLVAYVFWRSGGRFFSSEQLVTTLSDNFRWRREVNGQIRHYAGGKHLFWRDI